MIIGDVPFANEVEIVGAELNFPEDVSKGKQKPIFSEEQWEFIRLNAFSRLKRSLQDLAMRYDWLIWIYSPVMIALIKATEWLRQKLAVGNQNLVFKFSRT